jgi:MerR family transcriptional regulator, thiopeptide resistance regulator
MTLAFGNRGMKVGQLARRTGVTVRTLHYYDEIGLLSPSHHTEVGHRLYAGRDVVRLQLIRSLQEMGLSLDEIRECLRRSDFSLKRVLEMQIARLDEKIEMQTRLRERLKGIARGLEATGDVPVDELMQIMEAMAMVEKYYTPEQMEWLKQRAEMLGEEHIRAVEAEWPQLMEKVRIEMDKGTDPSDERVQAYARRWMELVNEFTGGNPGIEKSLRTMYEQESVKADRNPYIDPRATEYMVYINKALEAMKKAE